MFLLLLACADDAAVLAALAPTVDPVAADALVSATLFRDWNMHTLVATQGGVRLADEGEVFVPASGFGYGAFPVIDSGTGVRVLASDDEVLYASPDGRLGERGCVHALRHRAALGSA